VEVSKRAEQDGDGVMVMVMMMAVCGQVGMSF
jgi:hypothetical protein